jgi:hypothetical protein
MRGLIAEMKNEQSSKNTLKGPQHHDWKEFVV